MNKARKFNPHEYRRFTTLNIVLEIMIYIELILREWAVLCG